MEEEGWREGGGRGSRGSSVQSKRVHATCPFQASSAYKHDYNKARQIYTPRVVSKNSRPGWDLNPVSTELPE